jgi:hypothetical protein
MKNSLTTRSQAITMLLSLFPSSQNAPPGGSVPPSSDRIINRIWSFVDCARSTGMNRKRLRRIFFDKISQKE